LQHKRFGSGHRCACSDGHDRRVVASAARQKCVRRAQCRESAYIQRKVELTREPDDGLKPFSMRWEAARSPSLYILPHDPGFTTEQAALTCQVSTLELSTHCGALVGMADRGRAKPAARSCARTDPLLLTSRQQPQLLPPSSSGCHPASHSSAPHAASRTRAASARHRWLGEQRAPHATTCRSDQ
jgi:hypothetical protein